MRNRILAGAIILMILGAVWTPGAFAHRENGDVIRLHVIANSDSLADQAVKHRVRDAILDAWGDTFAAKKDRTAAEITVEANLSAITSIARETLKESGMTYGAASEYGLFPFPTRQYGDMLMPAGEYHALRVILGKGAGANWWCVLFPPLCVHDTSAHDTSDTPVKEEKEETEQLKTDEETEEAIEFNSSGSRAGKEMRPKIRFKIVEWVKGIFE